MGYFARKRFLLPSNLFLNDPLQRDSEAEHQLWGVSYNNSEIMSLYQINVGTPHYNHLSEGTQHTIILMWRIEIKNLRIIMKYYEILLVAGVVCMRPARAPDKRGY